MFFFLLFFLVQSPWYNILYEHISTIWLTDSLIMVLLQPVFSPLLCRRAIILTHESFSDLWWLELSQAYFSDIYTLRTEKWALQRPRRTSLFALAVVCELIPDSLRRPVPGPPLASLDSAVFKKRKKRMKIKFQPAPLESFNGQY